MTTTILDRDALALAEQMYHRLAPCLPQPPEGWEPPANVIDNPYIGFSVALWAICEDYAAHSPRETVLALLRYRADPEAVAQRQGGRP